MGSHEKLVDIHEGDDEKQGGRSESEGNGHTAQQENERDQ
jgi:hypothetical protein